MNKHIIPVHTESVDSNESLETCIICLDDVDDNTIYFPCKYSSCSCRYIIHLKCIKENNINECVICKSQINYPVQNDLIQIDMFKKNTRELTIENSTDAINLYRHETYDACCSRRYCCITNKFAICIFCMLIAGVFSIFIWYMSARNYE
jgi:hypothetical protein